MRRLTAMLLALLLLFALSATVYGYTVADDSLPGCSVVCDSSGLYLVGFSGKEVYTERPVPDGYSSDLSLQYSVASATVCGGYVVALCNDAANDQLIVYTYRIDSDILDSFAIPHRRVDYDIGFHYDSSGLWLPDESKPSVINRFSTGGKLLDSHDFGDNSAVVINGYGNDFYVICNRQLWRGGDGYTLIGGASVSNNAVFIGENVLKDHQGHIYRLSGSSAALIAAVESDGICAAAIASDGSVYYAYGSSLYCYDPQNARRVSYLNIGDATAALYCYGGTLYAVSEASSLYTISPSEFLPFPEPSTNGQHPAGNLNGDFPITSDVYRVDTANYRITGIKAPTTFAQFKSNLRYDGYQAELYRDGRRITSGKVGTAMTAVFSGYNRYTFELSVLGDLTGEGSVNSRDIKMLMDYLLGTVSFDGVYSDAADVSGDGETDILDLAILARMTAQN